MVTTRRRDYGAIPKPDRPPKNRVCRFFKLPAELRNQIYEYVLFSPVGVKFVLPGPQYSRRKICINGPVEKVKGEKRKITNSEANQLKYVNKQLRFETRGMELHLNKIFFTTTPVPVRAPSAQNSCRTFLDQLSPMWRKRLRTIIVQYPEPYNWGPRAKECRHRIIEICRDNPNMTVQWTYPCWNLNKSFCRFVEQAVELLITYRGVDALAGLPCPEYLDRRRINTQPSEYSVAHWRNGETLEFLSSAPNFRIFPCSSGKLKGCIRAAMRHCRRHMQCDQEQVKLWKLKALEWYEQGI